MNGYIRQINLEKKLNIKNINWRVFKINYEKYILENFKYKKDGNLIRKDRKNSSGSFDKDGYLIIKVKGKQFKAHRIVWLLNNGSFPDGELDHINRIRNDNRIENLRVADDYIQNNNKKPIINKDTNEQHIYVDKSTKGLIAKFVVRKGNKIYRFRNLEDAKKRRDELWKTISQN